jgi:hypothetical protein
MEAATYFFCLHCHKTSDDSLRFPIAISCGHHICCDCNQSFINQQINTFTCPFDKTECKLSMENKFKLSKELYQQKTEKKFKSIFCSVHQDKPVEFYCLKDSIFCCTSCINTHFEHAKYIKEIKDDLIMEYSQILKNELNSIEKDM